MLNSLRNLNGIKNNMAGLAVYLEHLPGENKSKHVFEYIKSHLNIGTYITVIDSGHSFKRLINIIGGSYIAFQNTLPRFTTDNYGKDNMTVFELSRCFESIDSSFIREHLLRKPSSLLVIQELWRVRMIIRDWDDIVKQHISNNGSHIICHLQGDMDNYQDLMQLTHN